MPIAVLIHIINEDPVLGEVEQLPGPTDTNLLVANPRRKDGKDIAFLQNSVTQVVWPIDRIAFIEVLPGEEEERIIGFVRE
jgi:hypothetical protein